MRPLLVLGLVILAVGALVLSLISLSGDGGGGDSPEVVGPAGGRDLGPIGPPSPGIESPEILPEVVDPDRRTKVAGSATLQGGSGLITGVVTDPEGQPIANAGLTLTQGGGNQQLEEVWRILNQGETDQRPMRSTRSRPDGTFEIRGLAAASDYALVADHALYRRVTKPFLAISESQPTEVTVVMRPGVRLHGRVTNHLGEPVPGAEVRLDASQLSALPGLAPTREVPTSKTDSDGYYRFDNATPGSVSLTVTAKGYGIQTARNLNVPSNREALIKDFRLEPGVTVAGRVFGPDRTGIEGAKLTIIGYDQRQTATAHTVSRANGEFVFDDLSEGVYTLTAVAEGWGQARLNRVQSGDVDVLVEMAEQGGILGHVYDGQSGAAVTEFKLSLHAHVVEGARLGRPIQQHGFRTEEGSFRLQGVEEGEYAVQVEAAGFAPTWSAPFKVTQGLVTPDVVVNMSPGGSLIGQVIDGVTGAPIGGVKVKTQANGTLDSPILHIFAPPGGTTRLPELEVVTDKEGHFSFATLPPDAYQLVLTHRKYPEKIVTDLRVNEGRELDVGVVKMPHGGTVRGTVFDAGGQPLAGATVRLTNTSRAFFNIERRTGPDGRFRIDRVPEGSYTMSAASQSPDEGNVFAILGEIKNSEVVVQVVEGEEVTQDLSLGG